jgi:hypothetical protein
VKLKPDRSPNVTNTMFEYSFAREDSQQQFSLTEKLGGPLISYHAQRYFKFVVSNESLIQVQQARNRACALWSAKQKGDICFHITSQGKSAIQEAQMTTI